MDFPAYPDCDNVEMRSVPCAVRVQDLDCGDAIIGVVDYEWCMEAVTIRQPLCSLHPLELQRAHGPPAWHVRSLRHCEGRALYPV